MHRHVRTVAAITTILFFALAALGARCQHKSRSEGRCIRTALKGEPYCEKHHPVNSQVKAAKRKRGMSKLEKLAIRSILEDHRDPAETDQKYEARQNMACQGLSLERAMEDLRAATEARAKAEKAATENKNPRWQKRLDEILNRAREKELSARQAVLEAERDYRAAENEYNSL